MKVMKKNQVEVIEVALSAAQANDNDSLATAITGSWSKIAPCWPLKNIIAVNPIAGFEDLSFEEGLRQAQACFQQTDIPQGLQQVNRASIKWLQAFFDKQQSTIPMPNRHAGFLQSTLSLIRFDKTIHHNDAQKLQWLEKLPLKPEQIIVEALASLGIPSQNQEQFLMLMLTSLAGWAGYIQYRAGWADAEDVADPCTVTQTEYLAFRLVLTCLLWPDAKQLLTWHQNDLQKADVSQVCDDLQASEADYQSDLLQQFDKAKLRENTHRPEAQLVFCIDVRSEPFRRALEAQGNYETYGVAGFFGVPVAIENSVTGERHASCPVLLKPAHTIVEQPDCSHQSCQKEHNRIQSLKKLYQSVKYTFTTPFSLVETMGLWNGLWMGVRSFAPLLATKIHTGLKSTIASDYNVTPDIKTIPFDQQVAYGAGALTVMGLTRHFAQLVVFCGHGSTTHNNAYATALDCGACGGRHGAPNARILADILNARNVRQALLKQGIAIPVDTVFIAAEHNTTTDEVTIYAQNLPADRIRQIEQLKQALAKSRNKNSQWRAQTLGVHINENQAQQTTALRAQDWAQVRPEWGLARNAAFIVAPRSLTKDINLEGRSFLHSYDWEQDKDGASLTAILTAPMVVAQWINAQYLFSTLDNVAFGGGSKITKNITGKIGIMQGNASDLMHGLPLQSVYATDDEAYHKSMRLTVIVYAPRTSIDSIIRQQKILQKLFGNGWVHLICIDPVQQQKLQLQRDLTWREL